MGFWQGAGLVRKKVDHGGGRFQSICRAVGRAMRFCCLLSLLNVHGLQVSSIWAGLAE